jgi:transmembrane sensor
MSEVRLKNLIEKYISGSHNPEEAALLKELLNTPEGIQQLNAIMDSQLAANNATADEYPEVVSRIIEGISQQIADERKVVVLSHKRMLWRWSAAASLLILISISAIIWTSSNTQKTELIASASSTTDVAAGKEGAILTLDDGRTIVLDSLGNQLLTTENGTTITLRNGQLIYKATNTAPETVSYNTMTTPRGRQFQLVLPDGSKVWLNAASSIRYPTVFTNKERKVEITGEAYFEVAHNRTAPFLVKMNNETEVEVLGTQFNINSYDNEESINTTLLEGSVKVTNNEGTTVLKPGQQAKITGSKKIQVLTEVNLEKVMAWKNGVFNFQDATLQEVMRQLERWYDIEVVYEGKIPKLEFFGKMGKDLSLANVLRGLEMSEVSFRIEGRKLIVLP